MNEPDQIDMMNQRELRDELRKLIARATRYREALELIAKYGGKTECEDGVACTGSWCAEQARTVLPEGKGATEVYHMETSEATDTTKDKCILVQVPQEYIKALAFYADPANWKSPSEGFALQYDREPSPVEKDKGRRARRLVNVRKGSDE